ncbi:MAG: hypothetical protein ACI9Y7_001296 [Dokdonia sp.]|jgi:hypothetical protein
MNVGKYNSLRKQVYIKTGRNTYLYYGLPVYFSYKILTEIK